MNEKKVKSLDEKGVFSDVPVIYSYRRTQAIGDGVLVDVSEMAKEAGFTVPVAVTRAVWTDVVVPSDEAKEQLGQSIDGRLWDVLWMLFVAIRRGESPGDTLCYSLIVADVDGQEEVQLKSVIGPGDTPEAVMTIMFPHED